MTRRWLLVAGALLLAVACDAKSEEDVIRRLIADSADLAEAKQAGDLMELTREGFIATPGRRNAKEAKQILLAAFLHYGRFKIHYPRPAVDIAAGGQQASSVVYFIIVRKNRSLPGLKELYENPRLWLAAAGEKADLYQLKCEWEKHGQRWQVVTADLRGFKGRRF